MTSKSLLINWNGANGSVATEICALVGGGRWRNTTITNQQTTAAVGATASNLSVYFLYSGGSNAGTCKLYKNGSSGNLSCAPPDASGMVTDNTHSDTYVTGDLLHYNFTMIGTAGFLTTTSMQVSSTTATCIHGAGSTGGTDISFSTVTHYATAMGGGSGGLGDTSASLTNQQFIENPGTASYFGIGISTASSGTATLTFNKNGSAGNGTVSSAGSGIVTDITHTDSCVAGDKLCTQHSSTSATGAWYACSFSYTNSTTAAMDGTGSTDGHTATTGAWTTMGGYMATNAGASQVQAQSQAYAPYAFTSALLRASWDLDQSGATATVAFAPNGSAGNQSVSVSGAAGSVFDNTHTDAVSAGNLFGAIVTTSGSPNFTTIGAGLNDNSISTAHSMSFGAVYG